MPLETTAPPLILRGPTDPDLLREECLPDILTATARRVPQRPALLWGNRTVTYAELATFAQTAGDALNRRGAGPGQILGLFLPRGADLLIAQAGISASGAAWLPFDAQTPFERIAACLQAAHALGVVTCRAWLPRLAALPVQAWAIEDLLAEAASVAPPASRPQPSPTDPAYVIYTSGSTGQPKGIVISHRSICHFLRSENSILGIRETDRVYQGFSVAFDMSFEEIWISYLVGAALWIAPPELVGDPVELAQTITQQNITVIHAVPTLMSLLEDPLPTVRLINLGGEACPEALAARLARPGRLVFNTYGPTEATVSASVALLEPGKPVTIGTPLPNYGMMVLDEQQQPVGVGEVGELCIFGVGLAVGYLGQPELTAARFIDNHWCDEDPDAARLYLTGDLARIDAEGQIHCLGRIDGQVKIRGFRVELGEIESQLACQPDVATAAVCVRPLSGIEQIVGYVVPVAGSNPQPTSLREALVSRLAPYMVPAHIQVVDRLPRLPSGKVDRKQLADWPLDLAVPLAKSHAPSNPHEEALYAAVGTLCPGQPLGPDADFFNDLGGHSLLAARLVSNLRSTPRYAALSVRDVYHQRTLGSIAKVMASLIAPTIAASTPARVGISKVRHFLCGTMQALVLPFLILLHIADWLVPFFAYHLLTGDEGDSIPHAAMLAVAAYLAVQVASFGIAIAGKWLIAGRLRPGRYPLWSVTYFRWWLADMLRQLPPTTLLSGTPLMAWYLRALGARIGRNVYIDSLEVRVPDQLVIEDEASIGMGVHLENARVEAGALIIEPVQLGWASVVDSYSVLEGGSTVEDGGRLGGLSALASGRRILAGQYWEGAPARFADRKSEPVPPRPAVSGFRKLLQIVYFVLAGLAVNALFFLPLFPSFMLIDWLDTTYWNPADNDINPVVSLGAYFLLAIPASVFLVLVTVLLAAGLRKLLLRRQVAGVWSIYSLVYCRKWLMSQVLENSLSVLHGLYASVFAAAWLRLMGARVGRGSEVSTTTGIVPDLLTLGEYSFVADGVLLGDEEQRGGWMILRPTTVGNRTFLGNGAYVPDGAAIPDQVLIGVQTRAPDNHLLAPGQTWLGSPPLPLPAREGPTGYAEALTFHPSLARRLGRAAVETQRIVLPIAAVIATGYVIVQFIVPLAEEERTAALALALAGAGMAFGLLSYLFVLVLKWAIMGRYRPCAVPMWSPYVWLSEAVTNLYESLAVPNLLGFLRGTPFLPWALRLLGARIGKRVYLDTTDLTEFDCVRIGDEAELNGWSGPQTHLFEDRVMKIGLVDIGGQVTIGACSTILYDTQVGDGVQLGPLTLVAKGEQLPAGTRWEGSPASPVADGAAISATQATS